jgi:hypothetical protein
LPSGSDLKGALAEFDNHAEKFCVHPKDPADTERPVRWFLPHVLPKFSRWDAELGQEGL